MSEPFRFPQAGELRNEEGIPLSIGDVYRLLIAAAPLLIVAGESVDADDPLNAPLLTWWNGMNALPRRLAVVCQAHIRREWGSLPPAPWEDIDDQGNVVGPELDTSYLEEVWERLNGEEE